MSFFAVLDTKDHDLRERFSVNELHVNVWSLASLSLARRALVVDVGVKITASDEPVSGIALAIPFRVLSHVDLSEQLTENKTAALIFDSVAWYNTKDSELHVDGSAMKLLRMDASSGKDAALSGDKISVWNVNFVDALAPGATGYYRMRFAVDPSRAWEMQPAWRWRVHDSLLVDLRVADVRSTLELSVGESIRSRVLPIMKAYVFVVLPQSFLPSDLSPKPKYTRLLEPRVWGRYLDRKAEFFGRRLVVYQWKSEPSKSGPREGESLGEQSFMVTQERPMRLYGRFDVKGRNGSRRTAAWAVFIVFAVVWVLFPLPFRPEVIEVADALFKWFQGTWIWVVATVGVLGLAPLLIDTVRWLRAVRDLSRRFESWVFMKIFRPES